MASSLSIADLLTPVSAELPCGELSDQMAGQVEALQKKLRALLPQQSLVNPGAQQDVEPPPSWSQLRQWSLALWRGEELPDLTVPTSSGNKVKLTPCRHLDLAVVLALAVLKVDGLAGFADGLSLIAGLLDSRWEDLHPVAVDDPDEPHYRRSNILARLGTPYRTDGDIWRFQERVYEAPLFTNDFGGLTVRDCLVPVANRLGLELPAGEPITSEQVAAARLEHIQTVPEILEEVQTAVRSLRRIEEIFRDRAGNVGVPKLAELQKVLGAIESVLEQREPEPVSQPVSQPGTTTTIPGAGPVPKSKPVGPVTNREDAVRLLGEVATYFQRYEPASPLPPMIQRLQRLATLNFVALLDELQLADGSAAAFRRLAGIPEKPEKKPEPESPAEGG